MQCERENVKERNRGRGIEFGLMELIVGVSNCSH